MYFGLQSLGFLICKGVVVSVVVIHKWDHALEAPSSVPGTLGTKLIVYDIIILL